MSLNSIDDNWRSHIVAHYWDTLMRHGLGNYRDLLQAARDDSQLVLNKDPKLTGPRGEALSTDG